MAKFDYIRRAFQSDLKPRARLVLNCLILHCNQEGACFPSIRTIAAECGYGVSTVKRALNDLLEAGYIEKQARFDERKRGGQTSNLYTLCTVSPALNESYDSTEIPAPQPKMSAAAEDRPRLVASSTTSPLPEAVTAVENHPELVASSATSLKTHVSGQLRRTPEPTYSTKRTTPPRGFSALFDLVGQHAGARACGFVFRGWTGGQSIFVPP